MKSLDSPKAPKKPHETSIHGFSVSDNYFWLREKENPEVIAYLKAENQYTEKVMKHTEDLQQTIYNEMVGRIQETDETSPIKHGDFYYYSRTEKGKQYSIFCRKKKSIDGDEQILLDLNHIAEKKKHDYLRMGVFKISPNHKLLAYSLDIDGSENFSIFFKDLDANENLPDQIENVSFSAEWGNDNKTLFYSTQDETKRSDKLFKHVIGAHKQDDLVFHEKNKLFNLHLSKTRDKKYLILTLGSIETSEQHVLEADTPMNDFRIIHPRENGLRYYIDHHENEFLVLTNMDGSKNNKIMKTQPHNPGKEYWFDYISHNEKIKIDSVDSFKNHIVLYQRQYGLRSIKIIEAKTKKTYDVQFPEPVYSYVSGSNPEYGSNILRFIYTSLTTAESVIDYDMNKNEWKLVKRKPVLGDYEPEDYITERIFAKATDEENVPISIVYHKKVKRDIENPLLLYGYGSYGLSIDPIFNSSRLSLLDRGIIFAIAHVRGGGEMGRQWYEDGKFLKKKNTFSDFISCARHLISKCYTSPEKLAIMGRSAGGLLMGAVNNMAPELFRVIIAGVPFVDVINTMLDESIPLTVGEFEEWGNPKEKAYFEYMLSYSPYDNVKAQDYPNILVTAGLNDPRVQYWEPAKWVAKLRDNKTNNNKLIMKVNLGAGHFSSSGRYEYLKELAFEYAFIMDTLGATDKIPSSQS